MAMGQARQISIRLENVAAIRGGRLVLESFSLRAHGGDLIWLRGPNGSGKSTLLRLIAGLLPLAGGTRSISGDIALADEHSPLDSHLPLERALNFWAEMDSASASERQAALAAFNLQGISEIPVSYLSAGQRKRADLSLMMNSGAQIWLLDEPYNGLDTDSADRLDRLLRKHADSGGIAVVAAHKNPAFEVAQTVNLNPATAQEETGEAA